MKRLSVFIAAAILVCAFTCHAKPPIKAVVTILPLEYFLEEIGKSHVFVTTLIPPGGNPHTYEPTPGQMNSISRADLYIKMGSGLEFELIWMDKLAALNRKMVICDVSQGIDIIKTADNEHSSHNDSNQHNHGTMDPHIWLSPVNGIIIAENIRDTLVRIDPENSDQYYDNASRLIEELNLLIHDIESDLSALKNRSFLVFHPSWGYFARDFNLEQIPLKQDGKEITPRMLGSIIKKARNEGARAIFASPQFSIKSASVIADEINGKVILIDAVKKEYMENLRSVSKILRENLQ